MVHSEVCPRTQGTSWAGQQQAEEDIAASAPLIRACATVYALISYQGLHIGIVLIMAFYVLARKVAPDRLVTIENVRVFWAYTVGQGLLVQALVHLGPRLLGS